MNFQVPDASEILDLAMDDRAIVRARRHGNPDGVRLYVSNGNGFATDGYYPFWSLLAERFDLIVFDVRNHGWNPPAGGEGHNYPQFVRDIGTIVHEVTERLGRRPSVGVFHSMSARAAMKHAVEVGYLWDGLVLFDPPSLPPEGHDLYEPMCKFEHALVKWAGERRDRYGDPSELAAEYAALRAHADWVEGAHQIMAESVLHQEPATGDWVLTCRRELEAAIYLAAIELDLWPIAAEMGGPVKLIGADPDTPHPAPTAAANQALAREGGYDYAAVPGTGHLLQIQKPAECAALLTEFVDGLGLGG